MDVSYQPSGKADDQEKLVASAIELKSEDAQDTIRTAGGIYLGELELVGSRKGAAFIGPAGGASTRSGRISLEAANRGATHFYAASTRVEHTVKAYGETPGHGFPRISVPNRVAPWANPRGSSAFDVSTRALLPRAGVLLLARTKPHAKEPHHG